MIKDAQLEKSVGASEDSRHFELPNIEIQGKKIALPSRESTGALPKSASTRQVGEPLKPHSCLFCENTMPEGDDDSYEVTINQLLKMQTFFKSAQIP